MRARGFSLAALVFGLVFTSVAVTALVQRLGIADVRFAAVWPVVVLVVGIAILANALLRRGLRAGAAAPAPAAVDGPPPPPSADAPAEKVPVDDVAHGDAGLEA